jgi:hypothetical protein
LVRLGEERGGLRIDRVGYGNNWVRCLSCTESFSFFSFFCSFVLNVFFDIFFVIAFSLLIALITSLRLSCVFLLIILNFYFLC